MVRELGKTVIMGENSTGKSVLVKSELVRAVVAYLSDDKECESDKGIKDGDNGRSE